MILQMLRNIAGSISRKIANVGDYTALFLYRNNIISPSGWFMRLICRSSSVRAIVLEELDSALERQENTKILEQLKKPEVKYIINAYQGTSYISHLLTRTRIRKETGKEINEIMSLLYLKPHSFIINLIDINDNNDLLKEIDQSEISKEQAMQVLIRAAEKNYVPIIDVGGVFEITNENFKTLFDKAANNKSDNFCASLVEKYFKLPNADKDITFEKIIFAEKNNLHILLDFYLNNSSKNDQNLFVKLFDYGLSNNKPFFVYKIFEWVEPEIIGNGFEYYFNKLINHNNYEKFAAALEWGLIACVYAGITKPLETFFECKKDIKITENNIKQLSYAILRADNSKLLEVSLQNVQFKTYLIDNYQEIIKQFLTPNQLCVNSLKILINMPEFKKKYGNFNLMTVLAPNMSGWVVDDDDAVIYNFLLKNGTNPDKNNIEIIKLILNIDKIVRDLLHCNVRNIHTSVNNIYVILTVFSAFDMELPEKLKEHILNAPISSEQFSKMINSRPFSNKEKLFEYAIKKENYSAIYNLLSSTKKGEIKISDFQCIQTLRLHMNINKNYIDLDEKSCILLEKITSHINNTNSYNEFFKFALENKLHNSVNLLLIKFPNLKDTHKKALKDYEANKAESKKESSPQKLSTQSPRSRLLA